VAAQITLSTAGLALQTELIFDELKALTPMQTMDEGMISQVFLDAARGAKEKTDHLERKLSKTEAPGG
jgi:hypothetical protein